MDVKGFPTIKYFVPGKPPQDYQGGRTAKDIVEFGNNLVPSLVKKVTAKNAADLLGAVADGKEPRVLLFTDKPATPLLFKALSNDFAKKATFVEVQKAQKEHCKKFDVTAFPTLLVLAPGGSAEGVRFDGAFQPRAIKSFVNSFLSESAALKLDTLPELRDQARGSDARQSLATNESANIVDHDASSPLT